TAGVLSGAVTSLLFGAAATAAGTELDAEVVGGGSPRVSSTSGDCLTVEVALSPGGGGLCCWAISAGCEIVDADVAAGIELVAGLCDVTAAATSAFKLCCVGSGGIVL